MQRKTVVTIVMGMAIILVISCKLPVSPQDSNSTANTPPTAAGMSVTGGTTSLPNAGSYDFGSTTTSSSTGPITFTITDSGTADLLLSGTPAVVLSGTDAGDFSLTEPALTTLSPSQTTSFQVTFAPSTVGSKTASLSIPNNVPGESPYTVTLTGDATLTPTPDISITQGAAGIASGTGSYSFGSVTTGDAGSPVTFTIKNSGTADLSLSGATPVVLAGTNAGDFAVTQPASSTLAPGATTSFTISFTSTAGGARSATVSVASDSPTNNPYTFTVSGTAYTPHLDITDQGSVTVSSGGTVDFGTIYSTATSTVTLRINNTGPSQSTLRLGSPAVLRSGTDATCFDITEPATSTVTGGTSSAFTVTFTPSNIVQNLKVFTATVTIQSNDPTLGSFTFTVTGSTHYYSFTTYGTTGTGTGQLDLPADVLYNPVDSHHYLYVADRGRNRILIFNSTTGAFVSEFGSSGTSAGDYIAGPVDLAYDSSGNIYVASQNIGLNSAFDFVQKFDAAGNWISGWGTLGTGNGYLGSVSGIAIGPDTVDGGQAMFVADSGNNLIQVFGMDGTFRRQWSIDRPQGIVVLSSGTVLVAASAVLVQSFNNDGSGQADWHNAVAYDYASHLALRSDLNELLVDSYAGYGHGIQIYDLSSGANLETVEVARYPASAGATFRYPVGMSWGNGNLYFMNYAGANPSTYGPNMLVIAKYQP